MRKDVKIVLIFGAVAVAGFFLWRWYQARQAAAQGGQGAVSQLGSNLNSIAPELVAGSSGPSSGPQVTMPVTITLTQPEASPAPVQPDNDTNFVSTPNVPRSPLTQSAVTGYGMPGNMPGDNEPEPAGGLEAVSA